MPAELTSGQHDQQNGHNAEDRGPYQKSPRMRWDDRADGAHQRQAPELTLDGTDPASYSYQAEHNPKWTAPYANKLACAIPEGERPAEDTYQSSDDRLARLHAADRNDGDGAAHRPTG